MERPLSQAKSGPQSDHHEGYIDWATYEENRHPRRSPRVCKVSSTPEACGAAVAVRSRRCPVWFVLQGSKVRFADQPEVGRLLFQQRSVVSLEVRFSNPGTQRSWIGRKIHLPLEHLTWHGPLEDWNR